MKQLTNEEIRDRVLEGTRRAVKKLVEKKRREGSYLVVSDNGKVVKKPASDIIIK